MNGLILSLFVIEWNQWSITIYVPLILKVRDVFFLSGSKRLRPPRKTPRNAPLYVLPQTTKIISRTFKIRGTLVFLCPNERERERERVRERER
jgi:hypothetical protein